MEWKPISTAPRDGNRITYRTSHEGAYGRAVWYDEDDEGPSGWYDALGNSVPANEWLAPPEGWQPIETAPRDGGEIIIAGTYGGPEGLPFVRGERWDGPERHHYNTRGRDCVTHWQPLPTPPAPTGRDGDREDG